MWRPTVKSKPYDFIASAERMRLQAKWALYQARRRGNRTPGELAALKRSIAYYDHVLPQWRAQRAELEAQQARMLRAADACVDAADKVVAAMRAA
jgi:hypothetical protein